MGRLMGLTSVVEVVAERGSLSVDSSLRSSPFAILGKNHSNLKEKIVWKKQEPKKNVLVYLSIKKAVEKSGKKPLVRDQECRHEAPYGKVDRVGVVGRSHHLQTVGNPQ